MSDSEAGALLMVASQFSLPRFSAGHGAGVSSQPSVHTRDDQPQTRRWLLGSVAGGEVVIEGRGEPPQWLERVITDLQRLLHLRQGWDSYAGRPISPPAAVQALSALFESLPDDGPAPQLVPTSDGGIQLEWHLRRLNIEVTVPPDGPVEVWYEDLVRGEEREATFDRATEIGDLSTALVFQGGAS